MAGELTSSAQDCFGSSLVIRSAREGPAGASEDILPRTGEEEEEVGRRPWARFEGLQRSVLGGEYSTIGGKGGGREGWPCGQMHGGGVGEATAEKAEVQENSEGMIHTLKCSLITASDCRSIILAPSLSLVPARVFFHWRHNPGRCTWQPHQDSHNLHEAETWAHPCYATPIPVATLFVWLLWFLRAWKTFRRRTTPWYE